MTPDPTTVHPLPACDRMVFLKPLVTSPTMPSRGHTVVGGNPARVLRQRFAEGVRW
ncbi:hypothetical protein ACTPOK_42830 [Streptomyces inhibens]|uniref:hypothetical protein n=1 Tax=Streptomyces inhibens TaxID=2293571 RepID=UPI00402AA17A